jgi:CRP-like cAMP-binding protein
MILPNSGTFKRRESLPLSQYCLWSIESGYVRSLTWNEAGDASTLGVWGAGDVIGKPFTKLKCYQLECLTPVSVSLFIADSQSTQTAYQHYLQQTEVMLGLMHVRAVSERLLKVLQWLSLRFGYATEQGWLLDVPLTHQVLAEMIGTTRVTVTRTLADLYRAGTLHSLKQHRILLPGFNPEHDLTELEL